MITRKELAGLALLAALSLGGYLLSSHLTYRAGFPLDDAWIHQTYARNLAELGEWSFLPGKPSAGSTAPLWSALLAIGYLLGAGPYVWAYFLGWLGLVGLGGVGYVAMRVLVPNKREWAFGAALLLIFEWHMVWAAGSGMETLLYTGLVTLILVWVMGGWGHWLWLGLLIGLCTWLRPDGVTLLAPAGLAILLPRGERRFAWGFPFRLVMVAGLGFLIGFLPYLLFNQMLAGDWWPNTFFAKQAEYALERSDFIGNRLWEQVVLPFVGVGVVGLPGIFLFLHKVWRERDWGILLGLLWALGYAGLYAWRLPVTYQYGRYLMPAMPVIWLVGLAGMAYWISMSSRHMWRRVVSRVWVLVMIVVAGVYWGRGANAYGLDVAFIESEMVETAHWVARHTGEEELVAAHDIGALGYFGKREILDLAGLVSPEVIPFIRDEERLGGYLVENNVAYLITLETWYPVLEARATVVFRTQGVFAAQLGGKAMVVYAWHEP